VSIGIHYAKSQSSFEEIQEMTKALTFLMSGDISRVRDATALTCVPGIYCILYTSSRRG